MSRWTVKELANFISNPKSLNDITLSQWQALILVFRESKLLASLYHSLVRNDLFDVQPHYVQRHLKAASVHANRQRRQVIYECQLLNQFLLAVDVKPIYLKGANYILRKSHNSYGRIVSDIDLLVSEKDIKKVEDRLKSGLWESEELSDYDEQYYRKWAHEIPPLVHFLRNTVLDVHHNLYLPISGRSLDIDLFVEHSELVGEQCRVLCPADTVLHSIIHLYMNEDFTNSFRDLYDLYSLMTEFGSEEFWQRLDFMANKTGYQKELYYCLKTLIQLFDFTTPDIFENLDVKYKRISSDFFIQFIVLNAITPKHNLLDTTKTKLARYVVFLRGHWLKMPTHILIYHLFIKSYTGVIKFVMGKHFLDKD